jgi:membrane associated rhomboid family serine protease
MSDEYDVKRCAKCAAWIPTTAAMCSYCGTSSPDQPPARPKGSILSVRHGVRVTNVLIAVNVAYLLFAVFAEYRAQRSGNVLQWIVTASGFGRGLERAGSYHHLLLADGEWWRVISATFLHAGILHIGLNMYSLRDLGHFVEDLFGPAKLLVVYLVCGACSTLSVSVWYAGVLRRPPHEIPPLVGASGAIFGVAGLLCVYLLRAGSERGRAIGISIAKNVAFMLVLGWLIPFVSNTAHVGGLVVGAAFGLTIRDRFSARIVPTAQWRWSMVAVLCVGFAIASLLAAAWHALRAGGGI